MATLLYRLGRFSARHWIATLCVWLSLLAVAVAGAALAGDGTDDAFRLPGTESQRALDTLAAKAPAATGTSAQLVFQAPPGRTLADPGSRAAVERALSAARHAPQVAAVSDPFTARTISPDRTVALARVQFGAGRGSLHAKAPDVLKQRVAEATRGGELRVLTGGDVFKTRNVQVSAKELAGVAAALIVLLVVFGSLLATGLTLLPALLGVAVALSALLGLTGAVTLSSTAVTLSLMIGLAVGIDYALFILSRHRAQLADGEEVRESIGRATGTAGSAVVFAGLTVVIALAGLSVVGIPFLTVMGLAASLTVAVAVTLAVTLMPALMGCAGERLRPRSRTARTRKPWSRRWAHLVTHRPALTVAVVVLGLGAVAVPAKDLQLALPDNGSAAPHTEARQAYDLISEHFGPGANGPLILLIQPQKNARGIVGPPHGPELQRAAAHVRAQVQRTDGVRAAVGPRMNPGGDLALLTVTPATGPTDERTGDLVQDLRKRAGGLERQTATSIAVTGATAAGIDVSDRLGGALLPFGCVVVGLALLLLLLVFRSLAVPVKAAAGFLLSLTAALGVVSAVFQHGWLSGLFGVHTTGPVVSFLPVIAVAVLFGLAMDYEVFLVSRMREEYVHGSGPREAVVNGFQHAARVVTAAALIMFAVFASFAASEDAIVKPMALAMAAGVFADAFVVRMTLVPAVLALLGRRAWWLPGWLDRVLPRTDIEGARLPGARGPGGSSAASDESGDRASDQARSSVTGSSVRGA
ncbi:MMPL family transporter [Streptomyces sp. ODS28]|uniref:MMPL family transporter n=1 Tax=Streptomyces sp. ODS28 TaxID=3136688 RepID=UPI0031F0ADC9